LTDGPRLAKKPDRRGHRNSDQEKQPEAGVVLHQPLNRAIFRNFGKKGQNLNGVSVSPGQKSQNAPTWQVEKQAGRSVIFKIFDQRMRVGRRWYRWVTPLSVTPRNTNTSYDTLQTSTHRVRATITNIIFTIPTTKSSTGPDRTLD